MKIAKTWFEEQLQVIRQWKIGDIIQIKGYKQKHYLCYFSVSYEDRELNFSVSRHRHHTEYIPDINRKIMKPCQHIHSWTGPHIFSLINLTLQKRLAQKSA